VQSFYYHINYRQLTQPPAPDIAYFHATWRREPRTAPENRTDPRRQPATLFVNMNMQGYDNGMQYLRGMNCVCLREDSSLREPGRRLFQGGWFHQRGIRHPTMAYPQDDTPHRIADTDSMCPMLYLHLISEVHDRTWRSNTEIATIAAPRTGINRPHARFRQCSSRARILPGSSGGASGRRYGASGSRPDDCGRDMTLRGE
jgi:hypothetical protein